MLNTIPLAIPPTDQRLTESDAPSAHGFTVADIAGRYRVDEDKVRLWIKRGELRAINTSAALCSRPRWVIPPEALIDFEKVRCRGPPPKLARRRVSLTDFLPD